MGTTIVPRIWRIDREAYGACLENRRLETARGFKSYIRRHGGKSYCLTIISACEVLTRTLWRGRATAPLSRGILLGLPCAVRTGVAGVVEETESVAKPKGVYMSHSGNGQRKYLKQSVNSLALHTWRIKHSWYCGGLLNRSPLCGAEVRALYSPPGWKTAFAQPPHIKLVDAPSVFSRTDPNRKSRSEVGAWTKRHLVNVLARKRCRLSMRG